MVAGSVIAVPLERVGLSAHSLSDGQLLWRAEITAVRPLVADEARIYVASADAIHALDAASGTVVWRTSVPGTLTAPPLAAGGWVIAAAEGELLAIRAADGDLVWRQRIGIVETKPVLDGDLLVASATEGDLVALELQSGAVRWTRKLGTMPTEPYTIGGRVYVGTKEKTFLVLDAESGQTDQRLSVGAVPRGRAAADDRHVYFTAMDNVLRAIDRGDGAIEWKQGLPYRPAAGPVLIGEVVVVPGYVAALPAFNVRNGQRAGQLTFPQMLAALPVFARGPDDAPVVVATSGGLENKYSLLLLERSPVPPLEVQPLTVLPGEAAPLPLPPGG